VTPMSSLPIRLNQGSPVHWVLRVAGALIVAYVALSPIFRTLSPSEYGQLVDIAVLGLAAVSLNLLIGFTGQISIGHSAFFGIGAYTLAILVADHGWSPGWTYPMAALICFVVGVLVGIPALRLKGLYLTLVTLALAQIFPVLVRKFDDLTGGSQGIGGLNYDAPAWTGLNTGRQGRAEWLYWVALGTLVLGYLLVRNLVKSRVGRSMIAVRDNTTAAAVMGVNVAITKTVVFGLSAALAGLAGCTFALRQTQTTPENLYFTIIGSIIFLVVMVIGGTGSLLGPIVGAFVYYRVEEFTRELPTKTWLPGWFSDFLEGRANLATIVFASLLIVLMYVAPFGIVGAAKRFGRRIVLIVPKPPPGHGGAAVEVAPPGVVEEDKITSSPSDIALT
jgi:branched-chain amino acid transport system permease protein